MNSLEGHFVQQSISMLCSSKIHRDGIVVFWLHQQLSERATMLRYTYIAYFAVITSTCVCSSLTFVTHIAASLSGSVPGDDHVIILGNGTSFGLVDIGDKGLKGSTTVGRQKAAKSVLIPTVHVTCFRGFAIVA